MTDDDPFFLPDPSPIPPPTHETWFLRRGMIWRGAKEAYWRSPPDDVCHHLHRAGQRFDLDMGLKEGVHRVFPGEDSGCKCFSDPIYVENGVPVGKDRFHRNVTLLAWATGAAILTVIGVIAWLEQ